MRGGPLSTLHLLSQRLLYRWVPKWYEAFHEADTYLFHERVGHAFRPIAVEQQRLLTQCRQISVYADARARGVFSCDIERHVQALVRYFHRPETGGWRFSITPSHEPLDNHYDLYGQAFAIFALAHGGSEQARALAVATAAFIDRAFRTEAGFHEKLDDDGSPRAARRRHESHMHLLEACLFAAEKWGDPLFMRLADEIVALFFTHFYQGGVLSEYFDDALRPRPDADAGHIIVEPGHYGEWVWLLKKHASLKERPDLYDETCLALLAFANAHGWDHDHTGIYDELTPTGAVIADTKRIWPFCELLKANALMIDAKGSDKEAIKAVIHKMVKVFRASYIQERGFWAEWLARDLSPMTDYMPGTTPYHVYFGIMETHDILKSRGPTRSLPTWMQVQWFRARRSVSNGVRAVRYRLK